MVNSSWTVVVELLVVAACGASHDMSVKVFMERARLTDAPPSARSDLRAAFALEEHDVDPSIEEILDNARRTRSRDFLDR